MVWNETIEGMPMVYYCTAVLDLKTVPCQSDSVNGRYFFLDDRKQTRNDENAVPFFPLR